MKTVSSLHTSSSESSKSYTTISNELYMRETCWPYSHKSATCSAKTQVFSVDQLGM